MHLGVLRLHLLSLFEDATRRVHPGERDVEHQALFPPAIISASVLEDLLDLLVDTEAVWVA